MLQTIETKKAISLTEWFNGTDILLNLGFSEKEIEQAIIQSGNSVDTLTEIKGFQTLPTYMKRAEVVHERGFSYYAEEYHENTDYKRTVQKTGIGVRIPDQYQGLKHAAILFALFSNKWAWFDSFKSREECSIKKYLSDLPISQIPAEFQHLTPQELKREYLLQKEVKECSKWKIYELSNNSEIYLETANGSLYVPIKALTDSDFSIIETRMTEYWGWYYKGKEDKMKEAISALESPEAIKLKEYLSK